MSEESIDIECIDNCEDCSHYEDCPLRDNETEESE